MERKRSKERGKGEREREEEGWGSREQEEGRELGGGLLVTGHTFRPGTAMGRGAQDEQGRGATTSPSVGQGSPRLGPPSPASWLPNPAASLGLCWGVG